MAERSEEAILSRFRRVKVLVVGDLILDQFIWGQVDRISPEAPVPVVRVTAEGFRLGGAANVAHNIRALGGRVFVCGVVGTDPHGRRLTEELERIGADTGGVISSRHHPTTRKTRIIAHQQQVVRLDREGSRSAAGRVGDRLGDLFHDYAGKVDVVVVSDYGKGVVTPELLEVAAVLRERRPYRLVIDPKQANFPHYRGASLVTPNREEASRASGVEITDERTLARAGAALLGRWQAEAILITRGEQGMSLVRPRRAPRHFPTAARKVFDVTGAGDTVVAACALALGAEAGPETAAVLANQAAGIVVGEVGTAVVSAKRLRAELRASARA